MTPNHDLPIGTIDYCQVCGSRNLHPVIDLGHQAPCDSLLWPHQLNEAERTYPLRLAVCRECTLAQIDHVVSPEVLFFPEYPYRSGITQTLVEKLSQTAASTLEKFPLLEGSLVIDVGSNDGTVLQAFKARGMRVLGVEATNIAAIANDNGIETLQGFFNEETAEQIVLSHGHASALVSTNVFAHVANLGSIMRGVTQLLRDGGVFVTESHYIVDLLDTVQYDSIYHEHLRYYSVKSITTLLEYYGFTVTDVERIGNYGGSIRVFAVKDEGAEVSPRVVELLELESGLGLDDIQIYTEFVERVYKARRDLLSLALSVKEDGGAVIGIGCPGRCSTLLNYSGIDPYLMPYIAEQSTSLKLGLYLPGRHIPIVDERRMFEEQPEYAVMLSWHYAEPIVGKLREKGLRSKIVVPLPEVHVFES